MRGDGIGNARDALHIYLEDEVPVLFIRRLTALPALRADDARIVHKYVDCAELGQGLRRHSLDGFLV